MAYIEKKNELKRKRQRKAKIKKLKARMEKAKNPGEAAVHVAKIKKLNPFWTAPAKAGK